MLDNTPTLMTTAMLQIPGAMCWEISAGSGGPPVCKAPIHPLFLEILGRLPAQSHKSTKFPFHAGADNRLQLIGNTVIIES